MSTQRIVAVLGRRDEPTDGVADYCSWLGAALAAYDYKLEIVRVPWHERGWSAALAELRQNAAAWRGCWVLLQFTNLAWSRRGFPLQAPQVLSILSKSGARCGVVFHDFAPLDGSRLIDRARRYCQGRVLRCLYAHADLGIFTIATSKIPWVSRDPAKAVFIPVGANFPEPPLDYAARTDAKKTVAIFSITGGASRQTEVADIGAAVKQASRTVGPVRVIVVGRGSKDAEPELRAEFEDRETANTDIELEILGLLPADEMSKAIARADVLLFVRGQISSRRGSAIAGIACGLPIVCYSGPETAWPITEAGIIAVRLGDRGALSAALERVLGEDDLRASLAERSRHAQEKYFSWPAIAGCFARALDGLGGVQEHKMAVPDAAFARKS
jgi:glycosyltransferase involved in cell wall biosynthesis